MATPGSAPKPKPCVFSSAFLEAPRAPVVTYAPSVETPSFEPSVEIRRRELAFRDHRDGFSLTLKRNCSMSPNGLACAFAALALATLAIGAGFAFVGAWVVLPFAGLEVLLLGAAFLLHGRHAADYERIELDAGRLTVEVADGERSTRAELDRRLVRVSVEPTQGKRGVRVVLRAPEKELEVGRNLDAEGRVRLAAELEKRLRV